MLEVAELAEFDSHLALAGRHAPVVVDFAAAWCGPCKLIAPVFEQLAARHAARATFLKVDVDRAHEIAQRARVRAMPTIHVYLGGEKVDEMTGADGGRLTALVGQWVERAALEARAAEARADSGSASARARRHAPATSCLLFPDGSAAKMLLKLRQLNARAPQPAGGADAAVSGAGDLGDELSEAQLEAVRALASRLPGGDGLGPPAPSPPAAGSARAAALALLQCIGGWPSAAAFPAVDLLRLAVLSERERPALAGVGDELVRATLDRACGAGAAEPSAMLGLRLLANCCAHARTAALLAPHREAIVERSGALLRSSERPGTRLAAATLLLNLAVLAAGGGSAGFEARVLVLSACAAALEAMASRPPPPPAGEPADAPDGEAAYRLAVAAGTLSLADAECGELAQALGLRAHAAALGAAAELAGWGPKVAEALAELADG